MSAARSSARSGDGEVMSRIGKLPIQIPAAVKIQVQDRDISVEGPKGKLAYQLPDGIAAKVDGQTLLVQRGGDENRDRAFHGLAQRLLANMVQGVSSGFTRTLEINGVGYRADVRGKALFMTLGYSHPIVYQLPDGVSAKVDKQTVIQLESHDKQLLGEVAAQIRALRPPEPYKGKGIKYSDETIRRKSGKAAGG